ncbi:MAG: hypothetical protein EBR71_00200 [Planctomycetes bacterium]|nr:hypothetical protein [Planctomycetota bacterium]
MAIEDAWSPRFTAFFGWYVERKLRGAFHAVRILPESDAALQAMRAHAGPVLVALNHASWWDPLIASRFVVGSVDRCAAAQAPLRRPGQPRADGRA